MAMTEEQFELLIEEAMAQLERKNDCLDESYRIGRTQEWKADLEVPVIRFLDDGQVVAKADLIVVGSLGRNDTWMWGWANTRLPEHVRSASEGLKAYAAETGLDLFAGPNWEADEEMAWWFAALACSRLEGEGAYRMPGTQADVFGVLKNVRTADN